MECDAVAEVSTERGKKEKKKKKVNKQGKKRMTSMFHMA